MKRVSVSSPSSNSKRAFEMEGGRNNGEEEGLVWLFSSVSWVWEKDGLVLEAWERCGEPWSEDVRLLESVGVGEMLWSEV